MVMASSSSSSRSCGGDGKGRSIAGLAVYGTIKARH